MTDPGLSRELSRELRAWATGDINTSPDELLVAAADALDAAEQRAKAEREAREDNLVGWNIAIDQRDRYHEDAERLAEALLDVLGVHGCHAVECEKAREALDRHDALRGKTDG
jgi:hypothetical protein